MQILFIHLTFPGQFKHLVSCLLEDKKNQIYFLATEPGPDCFAKNLTKIIVQRPGTGFCPQAIGYGLAALPALKKLKQQGVKPDLIYCHSTWGLSFFVKDVFPDVPLLSYFEWFYNHLNADIFVNNRSITTELSIEIRLNNIPILNDLLVCEAGITPTRWQLIQFPRVFRSKLRQIHDGIDTDFFKPGKRCLEFLNLDIPPDAPIITYTTRGFEPCRGFPQFIKALKLFLAENKKCHVIVVGNDKVYYGQERTDGRTWKQFMLEKIQLDMTRVHFLKPLPYGLYVKLLQASDVHLYLTKPYVLSWSILEAMSCGCVVVASDTEPVREVIKHGHNGFLTDLYAPHLIADGLQCALELDRPTRQRISENARKTIMNHFSLPVVLPEQLNLMQSLLTASKRVACKKSLFAGNVEC